MRSCYGQLALFLCFAEILFSNNALKSFLPCFFDLPGDTTEAQDNIESIV